jgi:hypothetical protein
VNRLDPTGRDTAEVAERIEITVSEKPALVALAAAIACVLNKAHSAFIAARNGTPIDAGPCLFKSRPRKCDLSGQTWYPVTRTIRCRYDCPSGEKCLDIETVEPPTTTLYVCPSEADEDTLTPCDLLPEP